MNLDAYRDKIIDRLARLGLDLQPAAFISGQPGDLHYLEMTLPNGGFLTLSVYGDASSPDMAAASAAIWDPSRKTGYPIAHEDYAWNAPAISVARQIVRLVQSEVGK